MGKFVIRKVPAGFDFYLKAVNGEAIGTSQVYSTKESCINGVESVMKSAPDAEVEDQTVNRYEQKKSPRFEIYYNKAGAFCFRLMAADGQEILTSQAYTAKASCHNGIRSVVENAPVADIEEEVDKK